MEEGQTDQPILPGASFFGRALFDYEAVEASELTIVAGDFLTIEEVNSSGWALAKKDDRAGWIPADYVEKVDSAVASSSAAAPAPVAASAAAAVPPSKDGNGSNALKDLEEAVSRVHVNKPTDNGDDRICAFCNEAIRSAFVVAKDSCFHPNHFKCLTCQTELGGRPYLEKDGKFYCEDDYYAAFNPRCASCSEIIKGSYIQAMDNCYHPEHFVCSVCSAPFTNGQYRRHEDKPFCDQHFIEMVAPKCANCTKPIPGAVFEAIGKKFHLECFVCKADGVMIGEGKPFHVDDKTGDVYCPPHFEDRFLEKCDACKQAIKGQYIKVMSQQLHTECWKCVQCHTALHPNTAAQKDGKFYCRTCITNAAPSTSSSGGSSTPAATPSAVDRAAEDRIQQQLAAAKAKTEEQKRVEAEAAAAIASRNFVDPSTKSFPYSVLKNKERPAEIDPSRREEYLSNEEFLQYFKVTKPEFAKLPKWKQETQKKQLGLF